MRKALILASMLVLAGGGAVLAGALLPQTRSGSAEAIIAAPRERIIAIIRDVARQPEWRDGVQSVETLPDGGFVETTAQGETIAFDWVEDPDADLALRFTSSRGYRGEWTATLHEAPGATRIVATEHVHLDRALARLVSHLFFDPADFSRRYLADLEARAERGE
jgi:hypothetical protein